MEEKKKLGSIPQFSKEGDDSLMEKVVLDKNQEEEETKIEEDESEEVEKEIETEEKKEIETEEKKEIETEKEEDEEIEEEKKPLEKKDIKPLSELTLEEKAALYEKLAPDYTRKTQELSKIKNEEKKIDVVPAKGLKEISKELADKYNWEEDQAKNMAEAVMDVVSSLGYVKKGDIQADNYQNSAQKEIDAFVAEYPEFSKSNDPNDTRWNALLGEFGLYKTPSSPELVGKLLRKARKDVFGSKTENNSEARLLAGIKKNKVATLGSGGGSSSRDITKKYSISNDEIQIYRNSGWTNKEINELFLE